MKIYFAGSIRGGRQYADTYAYVIKGLQNAGHEVLSEHVGFSDLKEKLRDDAIYRRDLCWIEDSDIVIADVSLPSLGVGFEISYALFKLDKPVYCFALAQDDINVSAMITGCWRTKVLYYNNPEHYLTSVLYCLLKQKEQSK